MNSLLIYCGHELLQSYFPVQFHVADTHAALVGVDVWGTAFWLAVSVVLYRYNIFLTL